MQTAFDVAAASTDAAAAAAANDDAGSLTLSSARTPTALTHSMTM